MSKRVSNPPPTGRRPAPPPHPPAPRQRDVGGMSPIQSVGDAALDVLQKAIDQQRARNAKERGTMKTGSFSFVEHRVEGWVGVVGEAPPQAGRRMLAVVRMTREGKDVPRGVAVLMTPGEAIQYLLPRNREAQLFIAGLVKERWVEPSLFEGEPSRALADGEKAA